MAHRLPFAQIIAATLLVGGLALGLNAQTVAFTWTGKADSDSWFNAGNWATGSVPNDDQTDQVIFGDSKRNNITLYDNSQYYGVNTYGLTISGNTRPYYLNGNYDGYVTMSIGAGGLTYAPTQSMTSVIDARVDFTASQTWNIASGTLVIEGRIYDGDSDYVFTKTGAGTLAFDYYYNDFDASTINLNDGRLALAAVSYRGYHPLGYAELNIGPATEGHNPILVANYNYSDQVALNNQITLNGALSTENHAKLYLTGTVTLNADTTIQSKGETLYIEGAIEDAMPIITESNPAPASSAHKLTINSGNQVILSGYNTYSGGTHVENGILIFGGAGSLPAVGDLSTSDSGYIGLGDSNVTDIQTGYIDRFDKTATTGTIGFDSPVVNFSGTIDLTGFSPSVRLGSATTAYLQADITPQANEYRFGGGGGRLEVSSQLTDQTEPTTVSRSLVLNSPAATPLTLRLTNSSNNYSAGTSVTNSALIFANGSFSGGANTIAINHGGYVGFESWGDQSEASFVSNSLALIHPASVGMVGFDNVYSLSTDIDLSRFVNALYLGTTTQNSEGGTGLVLSGTITPAGDASAPYRFAAYKGGTLEIASSLTGQRAVHIGDPNSPATFGDYLQQKYSVVSLTGDNSSLTGPIMLYGGELKVGQGSGTVGADPTTALGSGVIAVTGMTLPTEWQGLDNEGPKPSLDVITNDLIIANNVNLSTSLNIASGARFTLAGKISGAGELYLEEGSYSKRTTLTLSNDGNDFSGGIYLSGYSNLTVAADHATGTGPLGFGYSSNSDIYFQTSAPVIGSLLMKDESDYASFYATQTNTVLTINQSEEGRFQGAFRSDAYPETESLRVVKTGTGTLRFEDGGLYFYNGTTEASLPDSPEVSLQINQGTLVIGNSFYTGEISGTTMWVHGGTLALDSARIYSQVIVDNGGTLAGHGQLNNAVSINAGGSISPGQPDSAPIGQLDITHLELNGGGTYTWEIQDAADPSAHDLINIFSDKTLVINATPEDRFTLKIVSLTIAGANGELAGFDPSQAYSWNIIDYDSIRSTFDPNAFIIDASLFANNLSFDANGNGAFSLSDTGSQIMLNFTPVPEPSTYALLAVGLGFIGINFWHQRRRA